jgi:hypothetical protein
VDHDGSVALADFLVLASNFGNANAAWEDGDLDGDGNVAFADFVILAENFGASCRQPNNDVTPPDASGATAHLSIFATGRAYQYRASYLSPDGQVSTESQVRLISTGEPWSSQPAVQAAVVYEYDFLPEDEQALLPHPANPGLAQPWSELDTTGVIERPGMIWMHPIRRNQFASTEVSPFPEARLPLEVGDEWSRAISIPDGKWGIWENTTVQSTYEVTGRELKKFPFAATEIEVWRIQATAEFPMGTSHATFYFNESYGFVEMTYATHAGEEIHFVMEQVQTS